MTEIRLSRADLRWLSRQVLQSVRLAGVTYQDVMQQYSPETLSWAVLPSVVQVFGKRFITKESVGRCGTLELVAKDYATTIQWLKSNPWDDEALHIAERGFAGSFLTNTGNHHDRLAIYAAEFAVNMAQTPTELVLSDDSAFVRVREKGDGKIFGVYKGFVGKTRCRNNAGIDWITKSRSFYLPGEFDLLDKILLVTDDDPQTRLALALLKSQPYPELMYDLEQRLWSTPKVGEASSFIPNAVRYSKGMFESIRFIWDTKNADSLYEAYRELHDNLVPEYMSKEYFYTIFPTGLTNRSDVIKVSLGLKRVEKLFERKSNE